MDRFSRFLCDPVKVIKNIIMILLSIGILFYVYFQAMNRVDSDIETEPCALVNINRTVDADSFIFRDESVVANSSEGTVVTLVSEGDRVSKGQMVANIYHDENSALLQDEINRIQRRLDILAQSNVDSEYVISDLAELDKEIGEILCDIHLSSAKGNLSSSISKSSELLVKLNKRDLIVDSEFDYGSEQERLLKEKQNLEDTINSVSTAVYAENSGYFYSEVDGYEKIFDISKVDDMSFKMFEDLSNSEPDEKMLDSGVVKIVNDFVWYTVCSVDSEKMAGIDEGNLYDVIFPENGNACIQMKVEKIVSNTTNVKTLVVFRANVLPHDFNYKRFQKAEIVLQSVQGLSVPKSAVRVVDGVRGVYILVGDVVRFRSIEITDERENYYVVKIKSRNDAFEQPEDMPEQNVKYISLYDNVIVSGKDLFDGKIVG